VYSDRWFLIQMSPVSNGGSSSRSSRRSTKSQLPSSWRSPAFTSPNTASPTISISFSESDEFSSQTSAASELPSAAVHLASAAAQLSPVATELSPTGLHPGQASESNPDLPRRRQRLDSVSSLRSVSSMNDVGANKHSASAYRNSDTHSCTNTP
jgi:hypothetical protein